MQLSAAMDDDKVYQRIGEFVVSFQWLENLIRQIGWFILDPTRRKWPPKDLRNETTASLFLKVQKLFLDALPQCRLSPDLEENFRSSFAANAARFHNLRKNRNRILHSAYIELKAGGEVRELMRSNPKLMTEGETDEPLFDREFLTEESFDEELREMAELAMFFNRCYIQLIQRLPRAERVPHSKKARD